MEYRTFKSTVYLEGASVETWGIEALNVISRLADISPERELAEKLCMQMNTYMLESVHMPDIVEDFLNR
ncbi:MAG: hypothetical protein GXY20_05365 [Clostridiales bacterium]|nr:hypothetical protein [Clostridiales bacterium]